jgi:trimeric autotransporter adhesin
MKNLFSTILFLFVTGFIFAQAPQGINYQAVIRDATGNILTNQNVRLRINIRTASVSGTVTYAETHSAITNAYGLVNLVIG